MTMLDVVMSTTAGSTLRRVSHDPDRARVSFDDPNLAANARLLLVATVAFAWSWSTS